MIQINEYYNGTVKSMVANTNDAKFTVGVMEAGEYEFSTATVEIMTVVAGEMKVMLSGKSDWSVFKPFESYRIEKGDSFKLLIEQTCAYRCEYL